MAQKNIFTLTVLIVAALTLSACGSGSSGPERDNVQARLDEDARIINVTMTDFAFSPATIQVAAGEKVQLVLRNEGRTVHDIAIYGLGVDVKSPMLSNGETAVLTFTPQRSGRIETFCTVPGHKALGMVGEITVD